MPKHRTCVFILLFLFQGAFSFNDTLFERLTFGLNETFNETYNGQICLSAVTNILNNNSTVVRLYPKIFFPESTPDYPLLTLQGCKTLCGPKWGRYPDIGPRLLEWILPGILLITNMHFSPIGKRRYLFIAHILGDPVNTFWRQLLLIEGWAQSSEKAHKKLSYGIRERYDVQPDDIAVVISVAERLYEPYDKFPRPFNKKEFCRQLFMALEVEAQPETSYVMLRETAIALRDQRLHDTRRTSLSILLYIFQIVAVFVPAIGGSASPSGARVAPAMMLLWLLSLVILSNAIGDYGSWRDSRRTLSKFLNVIGVNHHGLLDPDIPPTPFFSELSCTGVAIHPNPEGKYRTILAFLSILPVTFACATAFAVDYTAPTWFSCRATLIVGCWVLWLLSSVVSFVVAKFMPDSLDRHKWTLIWLKDVFVATISLVLIFLSSAGWFNSCYCVGRAMPPGNHAQIILNPKRFYGRNRIIYILAVSVGVALQMLILGVVRWGVQKEGFKAMWSKETEEAEGVAGAEEIPQVPERIRLRPLKDRTVIEVAEIEPQEMARAREE